MEAFSDGVFAIAITLLVLDLTVPDTTATMNDLGSALLEEWPAYLGYLVSFATIGVLWLGHNAITDYLTRADPILLRLNLVLLFFVCLLPFVTRLLSEFLTVDDAERIACTVYGVTLLLCSVLLSALWRYARRAGLIQPDLDDDEVSLLSSRLTPGLGGYIVVIILGLFFPKLAVVGFLVVALFLLTPLRLPRRRTRTSYHRA